MSRPTYAVEYIFYVNFIPRTGTPDDEFVVNPTLAPGDVKITRGDAAPVDLATLPVVDGDDQKWVKVVITATEMTEASGKIRLKFSDAAGAEWKDMGFHFDLEMPRAEPAQGQPPATAFQADKIDTIYAKTIGKKINDGAYVSVYAADGTTVLFKYAVSESGGNTTVGGAISGG